MPNLEVREVYVNTFRQWLETNLGPGGGDVDALLEAMFAGEAQRLERLLGRFALNLLSYHDRAGDEPEAVYQGFILGLCAVLEPHYRVRSNRESGHGRPDVLILPKQAGRPGVVLELKVAEAGANGMDRSLAAGAAQLKRRDYTAELRATGADPIQAFVVAFDGKQVRVERVDAV